MRGDEALQFGAPVVQVETGTHMTENHEAGGNIYSSISETFSLGWGNFQPRKQLIGFDAPQKRGSGGRRHFEMRLHWGRSISFCLLSGRCFSIQISPGVARRSYAELSSSDSRLLCV
jgi:hypothetical protein